jgi:hypothetical protein
LEFCFFGGLFYRCPGSTRDHVGVVLRSYAPPFVGRLGVADLTISQSEQMGSPPFGIPGAAALGDLDEPKGFQLAEGGSNRMAVHPILKEVSILTWRPRKFGQLI